MNLLEMHPRTLNFDITWALGLEGESCDIRTDAANSNFGTMEQHLCNPAEIGWCEAFQGDCKGSVVLSPWCL